MGLDGEEDVDNGMQDDEDDADFEERMITGPIAALELVSFAASLDFTFFNINNVLRAPTQEEIDLVLVETGKFYTDLLLTKFLNLDFVEAEFVSTQTNLEDEIPVSIDFDFNAYFKNEDGSAAIPLPSDIFVALEDANIQCK